jgi:hypothetical protein
MNGNLRDPLNKPVPPPGPSEPPPPFPAPSPMPPHPDPNPPRMPPPIVSCFKRNCDLRQAEFRRLGLGLLSPPPACRTKHKCGNNRAMGDWTEELQIHLQRSLLLPELPADSVEPNAVELDVSSEASTGAGYGALSLRTVGWTLLLVIPTAWCSVRLNFSRLNNSLNFMMSMS